MDSMWRHHGICFNFGWQEKPYHLLPSEVSMGQGSEKRYPWAQKGSNTTAISWMDTQNDVFLREGCFHSVVSWKRCHLMPLHFTGSGFGGYGFSFKEVSPASNIWCPILVTLPETNSSPMKILIFPGKYHQVMVDFHGRTVSFREGIYDELLSCWNWNRGGRESQGFFGTDVEIVFWSLCTFEGAIFDVLRITIRKKYASEIEHRYQRWPF